MLSYSADVKNDTEVNASIRISLKTSLDAYLRIVLGLWNIEQGVDAGIVEHELLVVNGVEGSRTDSEAFRQKDDSY